VCGKCNIHVVTEHILFQGNFVFVRIGLWKGKDLGQEVDFTPAFAQIGTLYNRAIRDHKNCWFLHDSYFDERMTTQFLKRQVSKC